MPVSLWAAWPGILAATPREERYRRLVNERSLGGEGARIFVGHLARCSCGNTKGGEVSPLRQRAFPGRRRCPYLCGPRGPVFFAAIPREERYRRLVNEHSLGGEGVRILVGIWPGVSARASGRSEAFAMVRRAWEDDRPIRILICRKRRRMRSSGSLSG